MFDSSNLCGLNGSNVSKRLHFIPKTTSFYTQNDVVLRHSSHLGHENSGCHQAWLIIKLELSNEVQLYYNLDVLEN